MSNLKVPKTVKILYRTFDIVERKSLTEVLDNPTYGNYYGVQNKIEWVRHSYDSENVDTILHELLHAIYRTFGLKDDSSEEEIVTQLSIGLTTVMKDNKKLFQALLDAL